MNRGRIFQAISSLPFSCSTCAIDRSVGNWTQLCQSAVLLVPRPVCTINQCRIGLFLLLLRHPYLLRHHLHRAEKREKTVHFPTRSCMPAVHQGLLPRPPVEALSSGESPQPHWHNPIGAVAETVVRKRYHRYES